MALIRTSEGSSNEPFPTPEQLYQRWAEEDAISLVRRVAMSTTVDGERFQLAQRLDRFIADARRIVAQLDGGA